MGLCTDSYTLTITDWVSPWGCEFKDIEIDARLDDGEVAIDEVRCDLLAEFADWPNRNPTLCLERKLTRALLNDADVMQQLYQEGRAAHAGRRQDYYQEMRMGA